MPTWQGLHRLASQGNTALDISKLLTLSKLRQFLKMSIRSASHDPFKTLPLEIAGLVISHLSPVDTETMRRVSKDWKNVCERVVGAEWIKKCFPKSGAAKQLFCSVDEANLAFRRLRKFILLNFYANGYKNGRNTRALYASRDLYTISYTT